MAERQNDCVALCKERPRVCPNGSRDMLHAGDGEGPTLQESDLPTFASLTKKSLVPGGDGTPALQKHLPELQEMLRKGAKKIIIHAATASRKSREIPSVLPHFLKRQLLTATPSRVDVKGMQQAAKVPSCYCMGHGAKYGDKQNASVVFATNGLVQQWYASDGEDYLSNYDGIFFDEIHAMETDPGYALLWEVALATQRKREFLIVGASATFTPELIGRLDEAGVKWISCLERPFPVEKFEVEVPTNNDVYVAVQHFCIGVLRKSNTALVFLPGKPEIEHMTSMLEKAGADARCDSL